MLLVFLPLSDNYETQPTEEDYDMVPNIYTSLTPTDYPPTYPEVQYRTGLDFIPTLIQHT